MKKMHKTVIITGGNRGLGEAITRAFYNQGYYVLIGARTDTKLSGKLGKRARFQIINACKESDHQALSESAIEWTGRLDVYINCVGISQWRALENVDNEFWNTMIDTNLKATFWGCKVAAKFLTKGSSIVNISSLAGKRGSANNSVYCAAKFGVNGLTQALAKELGPRGIRVNVVCPVYIKTGGLLEALKDKQSPTKGKNINSYLEKFAIDNAALRRLPNAEEVAKVCLFLASDDASAITGQCINVDCGVLPQ
jgi:3-oxoacyl-[acyl-carrier protein] reductase/meso-butanediol dehydrogenase/(S,S)-butanediol dehydrogenase/diacetyl reductase